ncbi:MAG: RsbRD N-terminal domain-containing protein, partial [Bdellovibrionaceae bacterium]|nr:RsbRD N-terminal domain-containing protein [Pseudobdellovibrionaceae bacterium]
MTAYSKLINRFETSSLLAKCKNKILQDWEQKAREAIEAAKVQSHIALEDSLPDFLDQLVETLKSTNPAVQNKKNS